MVPLLIAALLAGLLGSLHCVGMCGGFATSCARARLGLPAWHLGRILTYGLLGALAGLAGRLLPGPAWLPGALATVLLLWFALALAGLAPEPRLHPPGLRQAGARAAQRPSAAAQALFGVVNGFLPCGLVYSALTVPVALGDPLRGALTMLAFGLGTVPALSLAALGLRRLVLASLWRRRLFACLILASGLWTIWTRAITPVEPGMHHHGALPTVPPTDAGGRIGGVP
jgi:sulfite exporter TauE/SafE